MKSRWDDSTAQQFQGDPLALRVYTSRLLGQEPDLVLHGGGNTSVKARVTNFFGDPEEVLYVKGSGWDLATIEAPGFAPVRLSVLKRLAELPQLTDTEMVTQQRAAMLDPHAPNPSVEAILHAIIPFTYVDHTHADAVVTLTNTPDGNDRIKAVYGDRVLVIPYVMPGFILARTIKELTADVDWQRYDGMVLMNHGIFSFGDDARTAYERMIELVTVAEEYLQAHQACQFATAARDSEDLLTLAKIRRQVSQCRGCATLAQLDQRSEAIGFANLSNVATIATRGPLTPDHVIRTKPIPIVFDPGLKGDLSLAFTQYTDAYHDYFHTNADRHPSDTLKELDPAPRWGVWPGQGTLSFDRDLKSAQIITDIVEHTRRAIQMAEAMGGWQALDPYSLFEVEYWELEQAKLGKSGSKPEFLGKIVLVTGAASGIGKACAAAFLGLGAAVVGVDLNPAVSEIFKTPSFKGIEASVTDENAMKAAIETAIRTFGGLDVVVSNAGIFPPSQPIAELEADTWHQSLEVNLSSQRILLRHTIPYLQQGIDPAIVFVASRNVLAPGPGAAAYSVAKAGLTQLARVAALELAGDGIRVNIVHPDCVYDTGIWSEAILQSRANRYGMTVEQYKTRNLLKQSVSASEVAQMVCAMAGSLFAKTTGAQVPIDGGSDRVI
jgi:rhamnose utilization protein RhaD (predicted bifunctional aldolase and dehydrogenase)/NAD(P)-dependent dehydrogenase (short-subunit alcohol dehydrogenase family)